LFQQVRSKHREGAALADLQSALEGKRSTDLDAQVPTQRPARMTPHSRDTA
jgi:hypothetical protein